MIKTINIMCMLSIFLFLLSISGFVYAGAWDMDIAWPQNDPLWSKGQKMWEKHFKQDNLDELLDLLDKIEKKIPDQVEAHLWIARVCYVQGNKVEKDKRDYYIKSLKHVEKAILLSPENKTAIKLMAVLLPSLLDRDKIIKQYGDFLKKFSPMPRERALPDLKPYKNWNQAISLWEKRENIKNAKNAVELFARIADEYSDDGMASLWVARGMYYIGYYYFADKKYQEGVSYFKKGIEYAEKAKELMPDSIEAHYWLQLNMARSIQKTNIVNKGLNFKPILKNLLFCAKENGYHFYFGPTLSIGTMITHGGWIAKNNLNKRGMTIDNVLASLTIAEILYPDYFYITYAKADILFYKGLRDEAIKACNAMLRKDPYFNPVHGPENICVKKFTRTLLKENLAQ